MTRMLSLLFGAAAYGTLPLAFWLSESPVRETPSGETMVCGTGAVAMVVVASVVASTLSAGALATGTLAYLRLSPPRPANRILELLFVGLPVCVFGGVFLLAASVGE